MCGLDTENIALPCRRREPTPYMRRFVRRLLAPIQEYRAIRRLVPFRMIGNDLSRVWIHLFRNSHCRGTAVDVRPAVWTALIFRQRQNGSVPALGASEPGRVERQAEPVAQPWILRIVLRTDHRPFPRKIRLC